jgi:glycosyltransferase involved in cell wall biosynthesis
MEQAYPAIEIIVVDDGSTDSTAERVARYHPRVRCHRRSNSGGYPGVPRNFGIEHSSGEYLCFLDADDIMAPGRIEKQAQLLSHHPQAGVVFSDFRNFSAVGLFERTHFQTCPVLQAKLDGKPSLVLPSAEATAHLAQENFGGSNVMMIRRRVLDTVPCFAADLQVGEDFHFYFQAARQFAVGVVNHVGILRRLHDANMTGDTLRRLRNCIQSRTRLRDTETSAANRGLLDEYLFHCEIDLARAYADRRELKKAVIHNARALVASFPASLARLRLGLRTLARTATIAAHLKQPGP